MEGCKKELQQFTMLDLVSIEEKVSNTVQVPEYPYGDERAETVMDVVENDLGCCWGYGSVCRSEG